jgi:transcription initiation factor TFIIIB Brf1 subunit/transcription initiation factor TFIIB
MNCPSCNSFEVTYDGTYDFHTCKQCSYVWSDGLNDPDLDDDVAQAQEAIADRNIEIIQQWQPSN